MSVIAMLQQLTNRTPCGDGREWQRILFTGIALISASLGESPPISKREYDLGP